MAFPSTPRLYFAYGSSLSTSEMQSRCSTSKFYSIAVLRNHRWFVNERGYANIVPSLPGQNGLEDVVWGILHTLRPFDEELLDKNEGIPWAYSKEDMDVEAVSITEDGRGTRREVVRALVYIDRERVQESYPWPKFVVKMNKGIQEAVERGLPRTWVDKVVRPYMVDPSTENGTEGRVKADGSPPVHDGAQSASTARPVSDHGSHTQDSLVGGQFLNGGSQKGRSDHGSQSQGLEKSKYAHDGSMKMADRGKAPDKRGATAGQEKTATLGTHGYGNKNLECWWWRVKGSCRNSDEECPFAHHDTGIAANAPGTGKKKAVDKRPISIPHESVSWREDKPYPRANAENNGQKESYGYQQDWSGQQSTAETNASWSEQVENLMDSEPEWLASNDRTDVKW